jgi:hypothetical protein
MSWETPHDVPTPAGCNPCRFCGGMCQHTEQIDKDWGTGPTVIRIWNGCDLALSNDDLEKDDIRTEFEIPEKSVAWWNAMNPTDGSPPAYNAYDPRSK